MSFDQWKQRVDSALFRRVGVTSDDLPDVCLHDWFDDGMTPVEAARMLISYGP